MKKPKITFRRFYLDRLLNKQKYYGKVLDIGGLKANKRGDFRPPLNEVDSWQYANINSNSNPDFLCDATEIPVDENTYDIVLLTELLEHVKNPKAVLMESHRVLVPNGRIIITMPFLIAIHGDPDDYQRWTPSKFKIVLEEIGFEPPIIINMGGFFAVLYDLLRITLGAGSKNPNSIKIKLTNRLIMPALKNIFFLLDKKFHYKKKLITTGYFIESRKIS